MTNNQDSKLAMTDLLGKLRKTAHRQDQSLRATKNQIEQLELFLKK